MRALLSNGQRRGTKSAALRADHHEHVLAGTTTRELWSVIEVIAGGARSGDLFRGSFSPCAVGGGVAGSFRGTKMHLSRAQQWLQPVRSKLLQKQHCLVAGQKVPLGTILCGACYPDLNLLEVALCRFIWT